MEIANIKIFKTSSFTTFKVCLPSQFSNPIIFSKCNFLQKLQNMDNNSCYLHSQQIIDSESKWTLITKKAETYLKTLHIKNVKQEIKNAMKIKKLY